MTASARGLFRATGKSAKPVMTDLIDGEAIYCDAMPREKEDFYPTPPEPIRALLNAERDNLSSFSSIWEAAAGDGAMAREIEAEGYSTFRSDLVDRDCEAEIRSFYDYQEPPTTAMITNPPFCECNSGAWIRHALGVLKLPYMALLLPFNWPGAKSRAGLWEKYPPARVYLMRWRIDFTGAGAPPMLNAWFVWEDQSGAKETQLLMLDRSDAGQRGFDI